MNFPCVFCGKEMKCETPYDFYCSEECEKKDTKRIVKAIREGKHPVECLMESIGIRKTVKLIEPEKEAKK